MKKAMQRRGYNGDHPEHVLFKCINGFGSIEMLYSCHGKCQDGGRGNDDHCADDADVLTSKPRQQTISTLSSARMHHLEQQKQDEKVEDAIAALQILEEALTEKKAKIEGYENPADALAIVAVALEL
ncbi:MAG: hypothetical protein LQ343_004213 [Gyalolechia ehrenbergii]|nr:MAG: hypothetical protein LQ343_004213 [Gyalolechia ehrenbergii]